MKQYTAFFILSVSLCLTACGPSQKVSRVDAGEVTDLSGRWNDTDARLVSSEMIGDAHAAAWIERFVTSNDRPPVVIVGTVRNESMEHIDTEVFTLALERNLINTGRVDFVADSRSREALRAERMDQQSYSTPETAAALARETGADFMLMGSINSIYDENLRGNERAVYYTINLEMVNLESNQKVWIGNKEIKKFIERSRLRR
ncbi:MAG: penicillin-binding protein activator LpoB [Balneolales bacterium]